MTATLAFSNDIDFADWDTYREAHRVLENDFGIEAEDSFWLFDPAGSDMALFKGSVAEKGPRHDDLLQEIVDRRCTILHSAGNFTNCPPEIRCTRAMVAEGLAYLRDYARVPEIWVNHGGTADIQNIGGEEPAYQQGDDPSSSCYILDLLLDHGVKYFWHDRGSSNQFVLEAPGRDGAILSTEHTRSGHLITCFRRYRGALERAPDAQTLGQQLTERNLTTLVALGGTTIVYQHWCAHRDETGRPFTAGRPVFPPQSRAGLAYLAQLRNAGVLRITKLSSLLQQLADRASLPLTV